MMMMMKEEEEGGGGGICAGVSLTQKGVVGPFPARRPGTRGQEPQPKPLGCSVLPH